MAAVSDLNIGLAIDIINRQLEAIEREQAALLAPAKKGAKRSAMAMSKMTSQVMTVARGLAAYQAELRKTGDSVDEQIRNLTAERTAALALKLVSKLSPEYRAAVALHIQELDGKLISHGPPVQEGVYR
jgi:hypothetical protein